MPSRLFPRTDNWYEWRQEPPLAAQVYVRVGPGPAGRLVLTELRIEGEPTSGLLRSIPVGRIEAAANAQLTASDLEKGAAGAVSRRRDRRAPQLSDDGWDTSSAAVARLRPRSHRAMGHRLPAALRATGARGGHHDDFYAAVADLYRDLARSTSRPAVELAGANDVPVTTAHRWIKEARRRGLLAPGRPGKAG